MAERKISPATERSVNQLKESIAAYGNLWEEWSTSVYSPFNKKELAIIDSYIAHKSHRVYATAHKLAQKQVASAYHHAYRKLKQRSTWQNFQKWIVYKQLLAIGVARQGYNVESFVEPVARIQLPSKFFATLYEKFSKKMPVVLDSTEVAQPLLLRNFSGIQLQEIHRSQLCIHLYLSPENMPPH